MVTAAAYLLLQAPLILPAGIRTFPEVAAAVSTPATPVKCDRAIAHRAAFVSAKAISREGLLDALDLRLERDGSLLILRTKDTAVEREWANELRRSLERRYARVVRAGVVAADAGTPPLGEDDWFVPFNKILLDPKASPEERRRADEGMLEAMGVIAGHGKESEAAVRALAAFPASVPMELLERGTVVDTLSFGTLSAPALAALKRAYPKLQGGRDSIVVRRRRFGVQGPLLLEANLGVVDPGVVVPADWGVWATPFASNPATTYTGMLVAAQADGSPKLRGFTEEIARLRVGEAEGRKLTERYLAEVPTEDPGELGSLSQVAEGWAAKGKDVVMELDPAAESAARVFLNGRLAPNGDWSPRVVEGVLVLRPLLRFVHARRRYPIAALRALEAMGAKPQKRTMWGNASPSPEARAVYARFAGPADRWEATGYRGWDPDVLDQGASQQRMLGVVPDSMLAEADASVKELTANPPALAKGAVEPERELRIPLAGLSSSARAAIAAELRAYAKHEGTHLLAYSPAALALYLRSGYLQVSVRRQSSREGRETMVWYSRSVLIYADIPGFGDSLLYGG